MRPAIAKANERVWMTQHLTDCVEIAIGVVAEWAVKNARTLPFQQYVVDKLFRIAPFARRPRRNALLRRRFIIRHIAIPGKDALVGRDSFPELLRWASLRHHTLPESGITKMYQFLRERQLGNCFPARTAREWIHRNFESKEYTCRSGQNLPQNIRTFIICLADTGH